MISREARGKGEKRERNWLPASGIRPQFIINRASSAQPSFHFEQKTIKHQILYTDTMTEDLSIVNINESNFNDFLFLIDKLAEYEKLNPPDDQARIRLKKDGLDENPKYEAYLGIVNNEPVAYVIYFFNYSSFLALPTLYIEDIFVLDEVQVLSRAGEGTRMR
jgi:hypothetical protein